MYDADIFHTVTSGDGASSRDTAVAGSSSPENRAIADAAPVDERQLSAVEVSAGRVVVARECADGAEGA